MMQLRSFEDRTQGLNNCSGAVAVCVVVAEPSETGARRLWCANVGGEVYKQGLISVKSEHASRRGYKNTDQ